MPTPCTARRTNGETCGNFAMRGGRVCHAHGGKAPAVRAAAAARLTDARLEQERQKRQRQVKQLVTEERERQVALQPWMDELGPEYIWDWHDPKTLRRIATEMRRAASELAQLAATTQPRVPTAGR